MRLSRVKSRKEYKGKKYVLIILFLVILPVISILPGYFGAKYLIIPKFFTEKSTYKENAFNQQQGTTPDTEELAPTGTEIVEEAFINTFELNGFDIYCIQVGSFSTKDNAQALAKELETKQMGSYIYEKDGYKVITLSLLDRKQIDILIPEVHQAYEEAFVVSTSIPTRAIKYSQEESQYSSLLQNQNDRLNKIFNDLSDYIYQSKSKALSVEELQKLILQLKNDLNQVKQDLILGKPSTRLQSFHDRYLALLSNMIEKIELSGNRQEVDIVEIQNLLTVGLYDYLDISLFSEL